VLQRGVDAVRYYFALLLVISVPGVYLYWFSIHPFVKFWRKVGARLTLAIHFSMMILVGVVMFQVRDQVMMVEYGTNWLLVLPAILLFAVSIALRKRIANAFSANLLIGLPELAPTKYPRELVTQGIYARIRHPRYVQVLLALWSYALFCNYLAVYVIALLALPWVMMVAKVEERELRQHFGEEYVRYCERVPPFIPRLGSR